MTDSKFNQKLINGINRLGKTWVRVGRSRAQNYCATLLPESLFLTMQSNIENSAPKDGNRRYKNKQG